MKSNIPPLRVDEEMLNLIKDIKIERIKFGTDANKIQSDRRLTKALARLIKQNADMYNTLIKSPLEDDRNYSRKRK